MGKKQASVLQVNLPTLNGQTSPAKELAGTHLASSEPLEAKSDLGRLGVSDENRSPNKSSFRESTPDLSFGIGAPKLSTESPYSPHSNPFGKRPSQRTPGALAFVRRLSELDTPPVDIKVDTMRQGQEGGEEQSAAQPSPEVSAADLQSSLDAVSRIEKILDEQTSSAEPPLPKLPNLAAVQEASHLAELAENELAITWTGTRIRTEEAPSSWRKRISNPTFNGTPSPTSSRASSASEPLLSAAGCAGAARAGRRESAGGSPAAVDSGVESSPFRTPRAAQQQPPPAAAVSPPTEEALRSSAEMFPRSFRIQRTGSTDSLASLLSMTSDITAREASFEAAREASALETILEPGETPERSREGGPRTYFGRACPNPAQLMLGDVPPAPVPRDGGETPRAQALRAPGAFASPIEVQARDEHTAAPPLSLDSAGGSQETALAASAWLQRQGAATPYAQLRQPSSLTPVIRRAHAAHSEAANQSGRRSRMAWSAVLVALQLLLILVPFALILLAPTLVPTLPKLGSHPTTSSKAASMSSSATFPYFSGSRAAGPPWWATLWPSAAAKNPGGPMDTAADFLQRLFRQETPGTTHAFFGLLPRATPAAPTPHLDKLLARANAWWSGQKATNGRPPPAAAAQPPRATAAAVNAKLKPQPPAKTPAQRSLERAQDLKPTIAATPSSAAPAPPPAAVPKQAKRLAPPPAKPTPLAPAPPKQQSVQLRPAQAPPAQKLRSPAAAAPTGGLAGSGSRVGSQAGRLTASLSRALRGLKHSAADATEGLLLRCSALIPRRAQPLLRAIRAQGQGAAAAAAIAVLCGTLAALIAFVARAPPLPQEDLPDGVPAPATPAASVPVAPTAGPRTAARRGRRAAAEEAPVSPRYGQRQAPTLSMPPPMTPVLVAPGQQRTARAARTAPVYTGAAQEKLLATADTPALRTRARTRRAAH